MGTKYQIKKGNNLGIIGLKIPKKIQNGVYPFFNSLKKAELISSFIWTLKFYDNITLFEQIIYDKKKTNLIGEFIFEDGPSNYENDNYNYNKKLYKVNTKTNKDSINWELFAIFNHLMKMKIIQKYIFQEIKTQK